MGLHAFCVGDRCLLSAVNITSIRIYRGSHIPDKAGYKVIAYASIHLEQDWRITHIRIVDTPEGNRKVEMPSVKSREGYADVVHALNEETRKELREEILRKIRRQDYYEHERANVP